MSLQFAAKLRKVEDKTKKNQFFFSEMKLLYHLVSLSTLRAHGEVTGDYSK